jgi:hypothetical protein
MNKKLLIFLLFLIFAANYSFAKRNFIESDSFFKEHLLKKTYDIDTSAVALVLYESTDCFIKDFMVTAKVRRIIKIVKKAGVDEGNVSVYVYSTEGNFGGISNIHAQTYNLVNGAVEKKVMADNAIKIDRGSDNFIYGKFSLPAVSEGSILDYTYETKKAVDGVISNWEIEGALPKLVSQFSIYYPDMIRVAFTFQGTPEFPEFDDNKSDSVAPIAYTTPLATPDIGYYSKRWVRRDVPGIPNENYVYNKRNYSERMVFRLAGVHKTDTWYRYESGYYNWPFLNKRLKERRTAFGQLKDGHYGPAKQFLKKIGAQGGDKLANAKTIYNYIRDSFTYKGSSLTTLRDLDWVLRNNLGNRLDLNLALISALREAGMEAYPVLLSTRESVKLVEDFPNGEGIDYILTSLKVDGETYYLDPTKKYYPFGTISPSCYNGFAWVVTDTGTGIQLDPKDIKERMVIQVKTLKNSIDDYRIHIQKVYGKYTAAGKRERWLTDTLLIKKDLLQDVKDAIVEGKLLEYKVNNLNNPDATLSVEYDVKCGLPNDNIFFQPSIYNYFTESPFKSERRYNPIEMGYAIDINYSIVLQLPEHYQVENPPSSSMLEYDNDDYYKYLIQYYPETNSLQLNTKLSMQRTIFLPKEYNDLKSFVNKIIETQQKAILIKKVS